MTLLKNPVPLPLCSSSQSSPVARTCLIWPCTSPKPTRRAPADLPNANPEFNMSSCSHMQSHAVACSRMQSHAVACSRMQSLRPCRWYSALEPGARRLALPPGKELPGQMQPERRVQRPRPNNSEIVWHQTPLHCGTSAQMQLLWNLRAGFCLPPVQALGSHTSFKRELQLPAPNKTGRRSFSAQGTKTGRSEHTALRVCAAPACFLSGRKQTERNQ